MSLSLVLCRRIAEHFFLRHYLGEEGEGGGEKERKSLEVAWLLVVLPGLDRHHTTS